MYAAWIEDCVVQRVSLHDGVVLGFADYNEVVISRPLRLTLPAVGEFPVEMVLIDPDRVAVYERPLFDLAGTVCTSAWYGDDGALHLGFSAGHRIDVDAEADATAWECTANITAIWRVCPVGGFGWFATICPRTPASIPRSGDAGGGA
ncbi:hypothetical protein C1Y40_00622 [Mycobacterium talmoniae]|uniref:Uncharacterized protein n=1 Tax=Mycobacterium talmoniae TaxID=1858794 RepID=A0A2S8BR59_9MYCO|nr:hypothetical protein C1Y40_00622 [Mycobacterium talmoniae]